MRQLVELVLAGIPVVLVIVAIHLWLAKRGKGPALARKRPTMRRVRPPRASASTPLDERRVEEPRALTDLLDARAVRLDAHAENKHDAIELAGALLVANGAATRAYVDSMHERELQVSTYMGHGLAIPHGTVEQKRELRSGGISLVRLAEPVDWDGHEVRFVVAIACHNHEHLQMLGRLARIFSQRSVIDDLTAASTPEHVVEILAG